MDESILILAPLDPIIYQCIELWRSEKCTAEVALDCMNKNIKSSARYFAEELALSRPVELIIADAEKDTTKDQIHQLLCVKLALQARYRNTREDRSMMWIIEDGKVVPEYEYGLQGALRS